MLQYSRSRIGYIKTLNVIISLFSIPVNEIINRTFIILKYIYIQNIFSYKEFICNCSDIDDVIIFYKDGKYKIVRISDKLFVGKNILYVNVFKKNDKRTIYNLIYRDGKEGNYYIKRFNVTSMIRDREYDATKGEPGSKVVYFTANPNGEAEVIRVVLRPNVRIKKTAFDKDFSTIHIKGRQSMGNLLTKFEVHKITLKQRGGSTLEDVRFGLITMSCV